MILQQNSLQVKAHNPEQEEAEDEISIEYDGNEFEIGFNATYLQDAINAVTSDKVKITLTDSGNNQCLIQDPDDDSSNYVVMPMRL